MRMARRAAAVAALSAMAATAADGPAARAAEMPTERGAEVSDEASELLALIYRYYPRWDPEIESLDAFYDAKVHVSPQDRARRAAAKAGFANRPAWLDTVAAIARALPARYDIADMTSGGDPSHAAVVGTSPMPDDGLDVSLVVCASDLAPYYVLFEKHIARVRGTNERFSYVFELTDAFADAIPVIEREVTDRHGYRRLDAALAQMIVPGVAIRHEIPGRDTVALALCGTYHL